MRVAIIGCSHAGIICALRTREEFPEAQVVIYEKLKEIAFISQAIPYYLLGHSKVLDHSNYMSVQGLREAGIEVRNQTAVQKIDCARKEIVYSSIDHLHDTQTDSYDRLVMATGSYPVLPHFDGVGSSAKVYSIKVLTDAQKLGHLMDTAKSVVIIGAGMIGTEIAHIYNAHGVHVTLVQAHDTILNRYLDAEVSQAFEETLHDEGLDIRTNCLATDIREVRGKTMVYLDDGSTVESDGVILTAGFRPNSFLLGDQAVLGDKGAFEVDEYMRTSLPDVFAVGDCATTYLNQSGSKIYLPHASQALRSAAIAAINLAGPKQKINPSQGTFFVPISGVSLAVSGLTLRDALKAGIDADIVRIDKSFIDRPGSLQTWLVYQQADANGRHTILGFEAKGVDSGISSVAAATANFFSLAIEQGLAIEDVEFTDVYFEYGFTDPMSFPQMYAAAIRTRERDRQTEARPTAREQ